MLNVPRMLMMVDAKYAAKFFVPTLERVQICTVLLCFFCCVFTQVNVATKTMECFMNNIAIALLMASINSKHSKLPLEYNIVALRQRKDKQGQGR